MKIVNHNLDKEVFIIAEIGNNHEGSYTLAEELVGKAAETGVQAVKFQTFKTQYYVSSKDKARFDRLKSFELTYPQFENLSKLAKSLGLVFMSTPFDLDSADFLSTVVDAFKISSGDNNFYPLIKKVAQFGKPTVLSSGLADIRLLKKAKSQIENTWKENQIKQELAILHCVSSYPVPPEEANLGAIKDIKENLACTVGYSDHTLGIEAALISLTQGARIIEKHFTINKNYSEFRDHQLSADPQDMKNLVQLVREYQNNTQKIFDLYPKANLYIGAGQKDVAPSEKNNLVLARRSIVAKCDIKKGTELSWEHLTWIRPGNGLEPGNENLLVGKIANKDIRAFDILSLECIN